MAAPAIVAFGAYLRDLRERRSLSLDDVESLSSAFPDPVGKAYLSRCENGKLKIAFSKTIALGKIFEVPSDVLAERMRLDLEIDRIGGPDTAGRNYKEMFRAAWDASHEGRPWVAYALARDGVPVSKSKPLIDHAVNPEQQSLAARLSLASMASTLGANGYASYELESIDQTRLSHYHRAGLLDRLQVQHRLRGDLARAAELGDAALALSRIHNYQGQEPLLLESRARTFLDAKDLDRAIECQQEAIRRFDRLAADDSKRIGAFLRLAEIYLVARRSAAARRVLTVATREARGHKLGRTEAQALCLLGDAEHQSGNVDRAAKIWQEASLQSRRHHDQKLRFNIQLRLYRYSLATEDERGAKSLRRRLDRLLPSISRRLPEVQEYLQLRG